MCFSSINLVEEPPAARKSVLFFLGFYLADLSVKDCNVVTRAAGKLADLGDTRGASGGSLASLDQPHQSLALRQLRGDARWPVLKKLEKR
jgi:hypothetical protein